MYRYPSPRNRIFKMLSSGVGYKVDSIIDFVMRDKRVNCSSDGNVLGELSVLVSRGFVKAGV